MKVVLILSNSEDPDEMQHYAAFHLGLHCLPKNLFRGRVNECEWFLRYHLGRVLISYSPDQ